MDTETEFRNTSHGVETVIYRRDCVDGMRELLEPESIDVVVTSPPYNLGITYRSYDDAVPRAESRGLGRTWRPPNSRAFVVPNLLGKLDNDLGQLSNAC